MQKPEEGSFLPLESGFCTALALSKDLLLLFLSLVWPNDASMFLQQAIPLLRPLSATLSHAHASAVALVGAERGGAQENDRGGGGSDDGVIFYPPFGAGVQEGGR